MCVRLPSIFPAFFCLALDIADTDNTGEVRDRERERERDKGITVRLGVIV